MARLQKEKDDAIAAATDDRELALQQLREELSKGSTAGSGPDPQKEIKRLKRFHESEMARLQKEKDDALAEQQAAHEEALEGPLLRGEANAEEGAGELSTTNVLTYMTTTQNKGVPKVSGKPSTAPAAIETRLTTVDINALTAASVLIKATAEAMVGAIDECDSGDEQDHRAPAPAEAMQALKEEHARAMEAALSKVDQVHQAHLERLRDEHERAMQAELSKREQEYQSQLMQLTADGVPKTELQRVVDEHTRQMEEAQKRRDDAFKVELAERESQLKAELAKVQQERDAQIEAAVNELRAEHESELRKLKEEHALSTPAKAIAGVADSSPPAAQGGQDPDRRDAEYRAKRVMLQVEFKAQLEMALDEQKRQQERSLLQLQEAHSASVAALDAQLEREVLVSGNSAAAAAALLKATTAAVAADAEADVQQAKETSRAEAEAAVQEFKERIGKLEFENSKLHEVRAAVESVSRALETRDAVLNEDRDAIHQLSTAVAANRRGLMSLQQGLLPRVLDPPAQNGLQALSEWFDHREASEKPVVVTPGPGSPPGTAPTTAEKNVELDGNPRLDDSGRLSVHSVAPLELPEETPAPVARARNGYFCETFPDGSRYEGRWQNGYKHGEGRVTYPDGAIHDGQWVMGRAHGTGTYYSSSTRYEGEWLNNLKHGTATEESADGSRYSGEYFAGHRHGRGKINWPNGCVFEGQFRHDDATGFGVFSWPDGRRYQGCWSDSRMHGQGRMEWSDGRAFEGQFRDDMKDGMGTFWWPDGKTYAGTWKDDQQHGSGIVVSSAGDSRTGEWREGTRVKWGTDAQSTAVTPSTLIPGCVGVRDLLHRRPGRTGAQSPRRPSSGSMRRGGNGTPRRPVSAMQRSVREDEVLLPSLPMTGRRPMSAISPRRPLSGRAKLNGHTGRL